MTASDPTSCESEACRYLKEAFGSTKNPTKKNENDPDVDDGLFGSPIYGRHTKLEG